MQNNSIYFITNYHNYMYVSGFVNVLLCDGINMFSNLSQLPRFTQLTVATVVVWWMNKRSGMCFMCMVRYVRGSKSEKIRNVQTRQRPGKIQIWAKSGKSRDLLLGRRYEAHCIKISKHISPEGCHNICHVIFKVINLYVFDIMCNCY